MHMNKQNVLQTPGNNETNISVYTLQLQHCGFKVNADVMLKFFKLSWDVTKIPQFYNFTYWIFG